MKQKIIKMSAGVGASLLPAVALAAEMDHSMMEMESAGTGMDTLLLMLMSLGVFFLVASLYFLYTATRLYGGIIGGGLKIIAIGIAGVALNEVDMLLHMHFNVDITQIIFSGAVVEDLFHHLLNVIIFAAFTIGLLKLSGILSAVRKAEEPKAEKAKASAK